MNGLWQRGTQLEDKSTTSPLQGAKTRKMNAGQRSRLRVWGLQSPAVGEYRFWLDNTSIEILAVVADEAVLSIC